MTYAQFLTFATGVLANKLSPEEARTDARLLLDWIAKKRYAHLTHPDTVLDCEQSEILNRALHERKNGWPLPYLIGKQAFFGMEFQVDERVLIPRPETELLVETALQKLEIIEKPRVADLGTGSGCIAISIAKTRPDAGVFASDASPDALQLAAQNAHSLGVEVGFLTGKIGDWAAPIAPFAPFDAIVSNPPYIAPREIERLETGVRDFEPRLALDGGEDGLDCYRQLAVQLPKLLKSSGFVALELGAGQFPDVQMLFAAQNWHILPPIFDLAGHARVLVAHPGQTLFL